MAKKRRKEVKKEAEVFFVGIKDPVGIRRSILESSKDLLHYLSRFEKFKNVRNEKSEHLAKLNGVTAEITKLIGRLKSALPQTRLRARLHEHEKRIKGVKKKASIKKKEERGKTISRKRPAMTDLEKLETELGAIEKRLTKIT